LSKIIQAYKAAVTRWGRQNNRPDFGWQPRFYDRILRSEKSMAVVRRYIVNNPTKWNLDRDRQDNLWM
jgi:REP element-mobilizing transposase RayT